MKKRDSICIVLFFVFNNLLHISCMKKKQKSHLISDGFFVIEYV